MSDTSDVVHVMAAQKGGRQDDPGMYHCDLTAPWDPCDSANSYVNTVYHERSVHRNGHWYCPCGISSEHSEGMFVVPLLDD